MLLLKSIDTLCIRPQLLKKSSYMYFLKHFSVCLKCLSIRPQERTSPLKRSDLCDTRHQGMWLRPPFSGALWYFCFRREELTFWQVFYFAFKEKIFLFPLTTSFLKPNLTIAFFSGTSQTNPRFLRGEKLHLWPAGPGQPSSTLNQMKEIKAGRYWSKRKTTFI